MVKQEEMKYESKCLGVKTNAMPDILVRLCIVMLPSV